MKNKKLPPINSKIKLICDSIDRMSNEIKNVISNMDLLSVRLDKLDRAGFKKLKTHKEQPLGDGVQRIPRGNLDSSDIKVKEGTAQIIPTLRSE